MLVCYIAKSKSHGMRSYRQANLWITQDEMRVWEIIVMVNKLEITKDKSKVSAEEQRSKGHTILQINL